MIELNFEESEKSFTFFKITDTVSHKELLVGKLYCVMDHESLQLYEVQIESTTLEEFITRTLKITIPEFFDELRELLPENTSATWPFLFVYVKRKEELMSALKKLVENPLHPSNKIKIKDLF